MAMGVDRAETASGRRTEQPGLESCGVLLPIAKVIFVISKNAMFCAMNAMENHGLLVHRVLSTPVRFQVRGSFEPNTQWRY
jgi:hypothetical protein